MFNIKRITTARDLDRREQNWEDRCNANVGVIAARAKVDHWAAMLKANPCEVYKQAFNRAVRNIANAKALVRY